MSWYYELNNQQQGPVTEEALRELINAGELPPRSRVWTQGMADWEDFEKVFAGSDNTCPTCGIEVSPEQLIPAGDTQICAACKDGYTQRLREGVSTVMNPASRGTGGALTASELRAKARENLNGNWPPAVGASVVMWVLSIVGSLIPGIGLILQYALSGPLMLGIAGMFVKANREESIEFADTFKGFSQFLSALGMYFMIAIVVLGAALLGALPGGIFAGFVAFQSGGAPDENPLFGIAVIVAFVPASILAAYVSLRYALVYFVLADEDLDLGVMDAMKRSAELMKGRKLKYIWLSLTFIPWYLLGFLCLVVGLLWSQAYFNAATAAFYDDVHEAE